MAEPTTIIELLNKEKFVFKGVRASDMAMQLNRMMSEGPYVYPHADIGWVHHSEIRRIRHG